MNIRLENFLEFGRYTIVEGVTNTLKITTTIPAIALSILTLGKNERVNKWADRMDYCKEENKPFFSEMYYRGIQVIDPEFRFFDCFLEINASQIGSFSEPVIHFFGQKIIDSLNSKHFLAQHVFSRGLFLLAIPAITVTRIVDLVVGIFASFFSILLIAAPESIKPSDYFISEVCMTAYRNLSFLNVVDDVGRCLRGVVNPFQF